MLNEKFPSNQPSEKTPVGPWYEISFSGGHNYSLNQKEQEYLLELIRYNAENYTSNVGRMEFPINPFRHVDDDSLSIETIGDWLSAVYENQMAEKIEQILIAALGPEEAAQYTLGSHATDSTHRIGIKLTKKRHL